MIPSIELLHLYKRQNPRKYALKYGNRLPEEIVLEPTIPQQIGNISVEVAQAKAVEMEFKDIPVEQPVEQPKAPKKKAQKTKTDVQE